MRRFLEWKSLGILSGVLAGGLAVTGCGDDSPETVLVPDACAGVTNCQTVGETKCNDDGGGVLVCQQNAAGCAVWAAKVSCGTNASCANGQCSCEHVCDTTGATRCTGNVVERCSVDAFACRYWATFMDCTSTGQACEPTGSGAQCAGTCTPDCSTSGDQRCSGDKLQTCTAGADGCLRWATSTDCAANSPAQICNASGGTAVCVDPCTDGCPAADDKQCNGNVVQTCTLGTNGCLAWQTTTDCAANTPAQVCNTSGGTAVCVDPCTDGCPAANDKQCNGNVVQTCTLGTNGCLAWQTTTDCAANTPAQVCDASGGTAVCVGLAAGETCAFPQVITALPFQAAGTDFPTDYANDHSFAGGTNCGPADGAEAVFRIAMTAGQAIRIREMTAFDAVIRVLSACQDSAACLLSSDISEDVQFVAPATGDYFVVLESHSSTPSEVTWDFMISPTEPPQGLFEEFSTTNRNDLEGCSLTFTPNPTSQNRYGLVGTCACAPAWVVEPGTGTATTVLTLADSAASPYTFAHLPSFTFFGNSYSSMFVGSNGFVTFGSGDTGASSTVGSSGGFLSHPRIAGLDDDLNPAAGGIVTVDEFANRVVVTFDGVRFYGTTKVVSFQIVMDASGTITIVYLKIDDKADGYVGLSNGLSTGTLPSATNLLDVTPPPTNAGQLVLTEIHYNDSAASAEGNGEFIEIHNRSGFTLDLDCCVLSDTTGTFDIPAQTILDAGGYAVFVRSDVQADNGGIASGISYGNSIQLGNGNAEDITITCGGTVIDTVPFDAQPGWPAGANGASMQLAPIALTAAINDNPNVWCTSTSPYGSGDLGTPGAANEDCSTAFLSADFETDPSWSRAGDWAWGTPLSTYTGGPSACAGGTGCFGTNINGPYASNTDFNTNYVQSPPIDLSAVAYAVLTFDMWLVTEQSWDFARVELSTDGGATWTPVPMASPPYNGAGTHINKWHGSIATTWMPATGDLSAALGRSDVRLRWVLDADGSGARAGLYLDNVSVRGL